MTEAIPPLQQLPESEKYLNLGLQHALGDQLTRVVGMIRHAVTIEVGRGTLDSLLVQNLGSAARHLASAQQHLAAKVPLIPLIEPPQFVPAKTAEQDLAPHLDAPSITDSPLTETNNSGPTSRAQPQIKSTTSVSQKLPKLTRINSGERTAENIANHIRPTNPARPAMPESRPQTAGEPFGNAGFRPPATRQPAFEDEMIIAARRFIGMQASGWQGGRLTGPASTAKDIIESVPTYERHAMHAIWLKIDAVQRRAIVLARYYGKSVDEIAFFIKVPHKDVVKGLAEANKLFLVAKQAVQYRSAQKLPATAPSTLVEPDARPDNEHNMPELAGVPVVLIESPKCEMFWQDNEAMTAEEADIYRHGKINAIRMGSGLVRIHSAAEQTIQRDKCAIMASLGLSNAQIGKRLFITEDTVKTHMRRVFERYKITARSEIARKFLESGIYEVVNHYPIIWRSIRQKQVSVGIARGWSNAEIGRRLYLSEDTIKTYYRQISQENGLRCREQIALATVMSIPGELTEPFAA